MIQAATYNKPVFLVTLLLLLTACTSASQHHIVISGKQYTDLQWNTQDKQQAIAARTLYETTDSSSHLVRLNGREKPHYHDRHDLYVSILSGKSTLNFKHHSIDLEQGSFIIIPRGTYHWAENKGNEASILVTIFSPAFDGLDKRRAD